MKKITLLLIATLALAFNIQAQKNAKSSIIVVDITIEKPIVESFKYIVPVELSHIFKEYKSLPGIDSTSNKTLWYYPIQTRTVYFEDGNTAKETLLTVEEFSSFSYKIEGFTSSLRKIASQINGSWKFRETPEGHTYIEWTYEVIPKSGFKRMLFNLFAKKHLTVMLNNGLAILKEDLESGNLQPATGQ